MFRPVSDNLSIRERIVEQIETAIVNGEIKPGDRLPTERELAETFGASRTAVREALRSLAALGVLKIQHGRGIFVAEDGENILADRVFTPYMSKPENLKGLIELRKVLESEIARWAAERGTPEQKNKIVEVVQWIKDHNPNGEIEPEDAEQADEAFHMAVHEASGNPVVGRLTHNLLDLLHESRADSLRISGRAWKSILDHEHIAEAVLRGDGDGAAEAMRNHLESVEKAILQTVEAKSPAR